MTVKVGLALGSGAARGWAHIGIIEALEELGVKIDVVSGCSIGAYVGAAYTAGKLDELKNWIKDFDEWQVASLMGIGIQKGGLLSGDKVFAKLEHDLTLANIEDLPIPFGAVATDMRRGRAVWFTEGSTVNAVRASCSIPALFPPFWYQKKWFVDGAVVDSVPVSLCRHLGADFVIAVNLNSDYNSAFLGQHELEQKANDYKFSQFIEQSKVTLSQWWSNTFPKQSVEQPNEAINQQVEEAKAQISAMNDQPKQPGKPPIPSIFSVMSNVLDIMQDRVTRSQLAGNPPNILLAPRLGHIGIMEFHKSAELIEAGRANIERMAEQIKYQLSL